MAEDSRLGRNLPKRRLVADHGRGRSPPVSSFSKRRITVMIKRELPPGDFPALASAVLVERWVRETASWVLVPCDLWPGKLAETIREARANPGKEYCYQDPFEPYGVERYRVTASKPLPATSPDSSPAKPATYPILEMTIRDSFASSVAMGILAASPRDQPWPNADAVAAYSYRVADALLRVRSQPPENA